MLNLLRLSRITANSDFEEMAMKLAELVKDIRVSGVLIKTALLEKQDQVSEILSKYPSYFSKIWELLKS